MKLTLLIQDKPLDESSSPQDVLAHAIFDEKRTVSIRRWPDSALVHRWQSFLPDWRGMKMPTLQG